MKSFLINISIFGLGLVAINYCMLVLIEEQYFRKYESINLSSNTYFISDSRGVGISFDRDKVNVSNFSANGDSYIDMYRKINYLIKNTDVKKVLLTVDDHTLSTYREQFNNLDRSFYYVDWTKSDNKFEYFKYSLKRRLLLLNSRVRDRIKYTLLSKFFDLKKISSSKEWRNRSTDDRSTVTKARIKSQFPDDQQSYNLKLVLDDIISICKKSKVQLVGIKLPLTSEYIGELNGLNSKNKVSMIFQSHGLEVHDFSEIFYGRNDLFRDSDHLNGKGRKEFSKILYDKIFVEH